MGLNKKGIFFTLIAIAILSLFILAYSMVLYFTLDESEQKRVYTLNSFVFSVEKNMQRDLKISGYRIIFLMNKRIVEEGSYVNDVPSVFSEAFFNGTINGELEPLMSGVTFSGISNSLIYQASKLNANITLSNPSIEILQEDPWHVKVIFTTNLLLSDLSGLVFWNKTSTFIAYIPIENFNDPLYLINTNNLIAKKMVRTPYENFVFEGNVSNLLSHLQNSFYIESPSAPSFLDRLEGKNAPNPNGVESFVNFVELSSQGISVKDKSAVDYIYFSSFNPRSCKIQGMPDWFRIDEEHLSFYGVENLSYSCIQSFV